MFQHTNARTAISFAAATAPAVVGWKPGGWIVYDPKDGAPIGIEPELFIAAQGRLPLPLSEIGASVLRSALINPIGDRR